jgi:hypothetical protein
VLAPFLSYEDMGFFVAAPERSRARRVCAFIGAKRRPLMARTRRISW